MLRAAHGSFADAPAPLAPIPCQTRLGPNERRLIAVLASVDDMPPAVKGRGRPRRSGLRRRSQAQSPFAAGSTAAASPCGRIVNAIELRDYVNSTSGSGGSDSMPNCRAARVVIERSSARSSGGTGAG